jgi:hypothetical protein
MAERVADTVTASSLGTSVSAPVASGALATVPAASARRNAAEMARLNWIDMLAPLVVPMPWATARLSVERVDKKINPSCLFLPQRGKPLKRNSLDCFFRRPARYSRRCGSAGAGHGCRPS